MQGNRQAVNLGRVAVESDASIDESPDGYSVFLSPSCAGERERNEFEATMTITGKIRPHGFVRVGGKWCMEFSFVKPTDTDAEPFFVAECGGGNSPLSFDGAARLLFGS